MNKVERTSSSVRPATLAQAWYFMERPKISVGDIVVLREPFTNDFKFPRAGERCIVSQVLDEPYRSGDAMGSRPAARNDIALVLTVDDEVFETLYDSRKFEVVGSVYNPVTLANGETLPVE